MRELTTVILATAFVAIGCVNLAWAGEPGYTINIAAAGGKSSIAVGESLPLHVTYHFDKPQHRRDMPGQASVPRRALRRESMKVSVTLEGEQSPRMYGRRVATHSLSDTSGHKYASRYDVLYDSANKRLMFDRSGNYTVVVSDGRIKSEPLLVNVSAPSEATTKALSILKANKDYLAFMVDGVFKSKAALAAMQRIATECKPSPLAVRASARLGLEDFRELRTKHPSTDKWRALLRKGKTPAKELNETMSYLTEGLKLPVESEIRGQVIYSLAKLEWISGNSEKTRSLLRTLADQYPYGRYGKKATGYLADVKAIEAKERSAATTQPAPARTRPALTTRPGDIRITTASSLDISPYKPVWTIGQTWRVRASKMSEMPSRPPAQLIHWKPTMHTTTYLFTVEGVKAIGGEDCYLLRVRDVARDGKKIIRNPKRDRVGFRRAYLRRSDYTLKMTEWVWVLPDGSETVMSRIKYGHGPMETSDLGAPGLWGNPSFNSDPDARHSPYKAHSKGRMVLKLGNPCYQTETLAKATVGGQERTVMTIELWEKPDASLPRVRQTWVKGKPWWVEAQYYRDGKQWCHSRLLPPDGYASPIRLAAATQPAASAHPVAATRPAATPPAVSTRPAVR